MAEAGVPFLTKPPIKALAILPPPIKAMGSKREEIGIMQSLRSNKDLSLPLFA